MCAGSACGPTADTAWALGDTIQLAITITDAHGGIVPGVRVGWTSTDTSVASVDSAGTVVARAPGAATVVAAAGGRIAQSRILVRPRPAAIRSRATRCSGSAKAACPGSSRGWWTRGGIRCPDSRWRGARRIRRWPWWTAPAGSRASPPAAATLGGVGRRLVAELPVEVYPVPATITLLAGDGQRAPAGQRLAVPIKAQIVSRGGRPMAGVSGALHAWPSRPGASRPTPTPPTPTASCRRSGPWATARAASGCALAVDGEPPIATVARRGRRARGREHAHHAGRAPGGRGRLELPEPVVVRVSDSTGAPLGGRAGAWGRGRRDDRRRGPRTDSLGEARARWTLGPRAGSQRAFVQVGASRAVPRSCSRDGACRGRRDAGAGSGRRAPRHRRAPARARREVRVSDRHGNPVPGVRVSLRPGQGTVAERTAVTDSAGRVEAAWTLGPAAGLQRLTASAQGVEAPLEVTARAMAGAPAKLALEGVPAAATAGRPLPQPVRVLVTDAHGNAAAGASVVFSTRSGAVTPARARTDSAGRAQTRWVLGTACRRSGRGGGGEGRRAPRERQRPGNRGSQAQGALRSVANGSLAENLDDHPLPPLAVPLAVEHPLPGPRSSLPAVIGTMTSWPTVRLRRCAAALSSPVSLCRYRSGSQGAMVPSSHVEDVLPESGLVVVDEDRGADVHGGDEHEPLADPADGHLLARPRR